MANLARMLPFGRRYRVARSGTGLYKVTVYGRDGVMVQRFLFAHEQLKAAETYEGYGYKVDTSIG